MDAVKTKKLEKKKKIIETAYQLFINAGISATAIDDVVKSAGIARGTFYLYFKDKSDLLEQMVFYKSAETMKELMLETEQMLSPEVGFLTLVRRFVELFIRFYAEHKDVMMVLSKNMTSFLRHFPDLQDPEAQAFYDKIVDRFVAYGYTRDNAHKMIYIVIEMLSSVCADAILYDKPFTLSSLRRMITESAVSLIESGAAIPCEAAGEPDAAGTETEIRQEDIA